MANMVVAQRKWQRKLEASRREAVKKSLWLLLKKK